MKQEDYADKLIDVFIDGIVTAYDEPAWENMSLMGKLRELWGDTGASSGMALIRAVERLRREHAEFDSICEIVRRMLGDPRDNPKILALLARRYYQGINPLTDAAYTPRDRIALIGHSPVIGPNDDEDEAWDNAERRNRDRASKARKIIIDKISVKSTMCIACAS